MSHNNQDYTQHLLSHTNNTENCDYCLPEIDHELIQKDFKEELERSCSANYRNYMHRKFGFNFIDTLTIEEIERII